MEAARASTRRSTARGQTSSALPANSPRKSSMSPSSGSARQVSGSSRTGASGNAVCQPVKVTLSYCWSFESQPSTTSQKPMPFSRAERNLARSMNLPRRIPSLSNTATLTWLSPRSSTIARACAAVRTSSGCMKRSLLNSSRQAAALVGGGLEPPRVDLDSPAGLGGNRDLAVPHLVGILKEEPVFPWIVIRALDGELEVLAGVVDGAEQVHRAERDQRAVGAVRRAG